MAAKVLLLTMEYHHPLCYVPDVSTDREKKFITYRFLLKSTMSSGFTVLYIMK